MSGLEEPSRAMVTLTWVPRGPFEHGGDGGGVHAFGGLAVDGEDDVAGPDAGFVGRACLQRGRGRRSWFVRLRLDRHADAVVLAVLVFAHLREGLGVVEVGVGIEHVEHAGDGAVVDGLVDLVGVEVLGVVLLDDGVDIGEGVQGVAQGGLVAWRTGRRLCR